jgi:hypothetical protein
MSSGVNRLKMICRLALCALMPIAPHADADPLQGADFALTLARVWLNGRLYQVIPVRDARDPQQIIDEYRRSWERDGQVKLAQVIDTPWQLVTRRTPDSIETLRLKPSPDGAVGYITRLQLSQSRRVADHAARSLLPECTKVATEMVIEEDSLGSATTVTAQSCLGQVDAEHAIRVRLGRGGYSAEPSNGLTGLIRAVRGTRVLVVTVSPAATGSNVVLYLSGLGQ